MPHSISFHKNRIRLAKMPGVLLPLLSLSGLILTGYPAVAQAPPSELLPSLPESIPSPEEETLESPSLLPDEEPSVPASSPLKTDPPPTDAMDQITSEDCLPLADNLSEDPLDSFQVREITVFGSTVLQSEISDQVACYEGKEIILPDLFTLRSRITQLYLNAGYITSGAFIPTGQDLTTGNVQVQVIEGEIATLQINGLQRLKEGYIRDRLERAMVAPFNQQDLERGLQLLQVDPVLERVDAELTSGNAPGQSLLILNLQEAETFALSLDADNYRSPSIGSVGANVGLSISHPLGIGDNLTANYGKTEGLNLYDISYVVPINASDGTFRIRASNSDSRIVQDAFRDVDIRSETTTVSAGFRQPLVRKPSEEFALGLDFDWRRSRSFILDDVPFSFSLGPEDGVSQVSALRFYQDWVKRSQSRVLAARSQFSVGLDVFDATTNDSGIDGRFFSWLGQFQWVEQVSPRFLVLTRVGAQVTPDGLLPIERFSLGGVGTVRGYSQNQLVADNAVTGSVEFRIPVTKDPSKLQLTPFLEAGVGWNNQIPDPDPSFLASLGLGMRWAISSDLLLQLDYGIPLTDANNTGNSLQENGFYFSVNYRPEF